MVYTASSVIYFSTIPTLQCLGHCVKLDKVDSDVNYYS